MKIKTMLITDLIAQIADRLMPELSEEAVRKKYAWWLLEKLTGKSHTDLLLQRTLTLNNEQHAQLEQWIGALVKEHKPLGYILDEMPFGNLMLRMRTPVLIARMETEDWVLQFIDKLKKAGLQRFTLLDMCAGSGCIALLIAATFPQATVYAVDICPDALALMHENKARLKLTNVHIIASDLFDEVSHELQFDLIVTNPPYITETEYATLDASVKDWEHKHALVAADEGLALIKKIIAQAPTYLRHHDTVKSAQIPQLSIEIGYQQGLAVERCMIDAGFVNVRIEKDSAHKNRVVTGSLADVAITKGP
jgi:release factor glutamine methyltransferase